MFARALSRRAVLRVTTLATVSGVVAALVLVNLPAQAAVSGSAQPVLGPARSGRTAGVLSSRLELLATPAVATSSAEAQADALSLPTTGAGALQRDDRQRVTVLVKLTDTGATTIDSLGALGQILNVSHDMSRATVMLAPENISGLNGIRAVTYADIVPGPTLSGSRVSLTNAVARRPVCRPVRSEADVQLRAALARTNFRGTGAGIAVGVLSDSFNESTSTSDDAAQDVRAGELPGPGNPCGWTAPIKVIADSATGGQDEGRAMMQSIHDLAPGARLMFASATGGQDVMAANIRRLAASGATVIVDDISYPDEPFFQSGVIDKAIADVTARYHVTYFSAAGNSNLVVAGRNVSSWESTEPRQTPCPALNNDVSATDYCVNFAPVTVSTSDPKFAMTVAPGGSIQPIVQWAEPVGKPNMTDFDVYLVDPVTHETLARSEDRQDFTQQPVEALDWQNSEAGYRKVAIVIKRYTGGVPDPGTADVPRIKIVFAQTYGVSRVTYNHSLPGSIVGPSIFGHNGGPDTISVAAVPYRNAATVEYFSSNGPVTHYFEQVGSLTALSTPQVIDAPQLAATDGVANSFFGEQVGGAWRFYGTSDAAPNAAAVAALLLAKYPWFTPAQVLTRLQLTAGRVGVQPVSTVGAGLVNALAAIAGTRALHRPVAPTGLRIVAGRSALVVSFRASPPAGPLRVLGYGVVCVSTVRGARSGSVMGTHTTLRVTRLTPNRPYRCSVSALNVLGFSRRLTTAASVVVRR